MGTAGPAGRASTIECLDLVLGPVDVSVAAGGGVECGRGCGWLRRPRPGVGRRPTSDPVQAHEAGAVRDDELSKVLARGHGCSRFGGQSSCDRRRGRKSRRVGVVGQALGLGPVRPARCSRVLPALTGGTSMGQHISHQGVGPFRSQQIPPWRTSQRPPRTPQSPWMNSRNRILSHSLSHSVADFGI